MQDGIDLINALAVHPETAKRLARRLWLWFVNETENAPDDFINTISQVYLQNEHAHAAGDPRRAHVEVTSGSGATVHAICLARRVRDPVLKEVGYSASPSSGDHAAPQQVSQLFEPPDVNGWELGPGWFSTAACWRG
jgi:uncharacterized protein (DUF1800 family)